MPQTCQYNGPHSSEPGRTMTVMPTETHWANMTTKKLWGTLNAQSWHIGIIVLVNGLTLNRHQAITCTNDDIIYRILLIRCWQHLPHLRPILTQYALAKGIRGLINLSSHRTVREPNHPQANCWRFTVILLRWYRRRIYIYSRDDLNLHDTGLIMEMLLTDIFQQAPSHLQLLWWFDDYWCRMCFTKQHVYHIHTVIEIIRQG